MSEEGLVCPFCSSANVKSQKTQQCKCLCLDYICPNGHVWHYGDNKRVIEGYVHPGEPFPWKDTLIALGLILMASFMLSIIQSSFPLS